MEKRFKETIQWLENTYKIKVTIHSSTSLNKKKYWGNIKYYDELESTDFYDNDAEAKENALHIAFDFIKKL